jgi:hypothetical protein
LVGESFSQIKTLIKPSYWFACDRICSLNQVMWRVSLYATDSLLRSHDVCCCGSHPNCLGVAYAHTSQDMLGIGLLRSLCLWVVELGAGLICCMQGQALPAAIRICFCMYLAQSSISCPVMPLKVAQGPNVWYMYRSSFSLLLLLGKCLLLSPSHTINNTAGHAPASACGSGIASSMLYSLLAQLTMVMSMFRLLRYVFIAAFIV